MNGVSFKYAIVKRETYVSAAVAIADGRNGQQEQQSRNEADHLLLLLLRRCHDVVSGVELFGRDAERERAARNVSAELIVCGTLYQFSLTRNSWSR